MHGQTMERELEVFMHATVMKQQSKREWYAIRGFMLASSGLLHVILLSMKYDCFLLTEL